MTLSNFLTDMRDSETKKVFVTEKQLRHFAMQSNQWEKMAYEQGKVIKKLMNKIDALEASIAIKDMEEVDTIDLFA